MYMNTTIDNNNYYAIISGFKLTDTILVAIGIIGVIATFAILVLFVGGGGVRHVPITFNEIIHSSIEGIK